MTIPLLTPSDIERRRGLVSMKRTATALLIAMAVIFCISFALQDEIPWLGWVRAASEGGMVGAIADWFAVTALFRHPLGLKIPHTAIIRRRKDEIGASLGEFVESNFLSEPVVRQKLESAQIGRKLGTWLARPENATRLAEEASVGAKGLLALLSDSDVQDVMEKLARTHLIEQPWSESIGAWGEGVVSAGGHHAAVGLVLDGVDDWLRNNPDAFARLVSSRLPSWVPSFLDKIVDDRLYREALAFIQRMKDDESDPARLAIDNYLLTIATDLQHEPLMIARFENAKAEIFDSPRVRELAASTWDTTKAALIDSLDNPESGLRVQLARTITDLGSRISTDSRLSAKLDTWVTDAAVYLVNTYRHEIASVITDTVERWDPREMSEKIELQVGRDLQFIRINGTVVGSLAGLAIFTVATLAFGS
ncbi:uncharacterized membrane-anchored protein YjiN (DUF445 family) [Okibacterium sp. HSC-33S16]|uniref:DUF445 domain-containing protein n=1 Tax=Okibacterium sp. HSC-33S16 TaxID=2910965 RepID=UPI00209D2613|nr:DUF445 domain-containing protein [Okibacterium sp. HSC-33S16]MCP2030204.1 uncharacterized membrane-anchored protein YjiN (DUF445 family) [Okibacterium sp. HSC-33S16]